MKPNEQIVAVWSAREHKTVSKQAHQSLQRRQHAKEQHDKALGASKAAHDVCQKRVDREPSAAITATRNQEQQGGRFTHVLNSEKRIAGDTEGPQHVHNTDK